MTLMNRLGNCRNPYQGDAKKVLCVCSAGLLRSPTAANVLSQHYGFNTRSAGVTEEYALIHVDEVLIQWADEIVCMEPWMADEIHNKVSGLKNVYVLNVPDMYRYMDEELQGLILKAYEDLEVFKKANDK